MKHLLSILALMAAVGCGSREQQIAENYYYKKYPNLTPTRDVRFFVSKNYTSRDYFVDWDLWIDHDIALSGYSLHVLPKQLEQYKDSVIKMCNDSLPSLLAVWETANAH